MKKNKRVILLVPLFASVMSVKAQNAHVAAGGVGTGSAGNVSYSIGQVVYGTSSAGGTSVAAGVQQAYDISVVSGLSESTSGLSLTAFPNPATDYVQLKISDYSIEDLTYQIFDTHGKLLDSRKIESAEETIMMKNYASATYFLKVIDQKNTNIKTFKIIKN
jgi:hypothetical protein